MRRVFTALTVVALAIVPCAWDSGDVRDASWLAAIVAAWPGAAGSLQDVQPPEQPEWLPVPHVIAESHFTFISAQEKEP